MTENKFKKYMSNVISYFLVLENFQYSN